MIGRQHQLWRRRRGLGTGGLATCRKHPNADQIQAGITSVVKGGADVNIRAMRLADVGNCGLEGIERPKLITKYQPTPDG